jgi:tRNA modification GTPase
MMKPLPDDTIAAISTPPGEGGIGIVRLSGKDAVAVTAALFHSPRGVQLRSVRSHSVHHGFILEPETGRLVDEVLVTVMRAPKTYTREDVVEVNCHGGALPVRRVLSLFLQSGARLAEPGEFTKRAFLNGRLDLSQAEAVMDLIRAKTDHARRLALQQLDGRLSERIMALRDAVVDLCAHVEAYIDFPEDDIPDLVQTELAMSCMQIVRDLRTLSNRYEEGRLYREGAAAAIVGKPNVGKSSLLNALLDADRAIVTEMPGTTRDVIEECLNIRGIPLRIMDTAGIRETHDLAEQEGVRRSLRALEGADIVLAVIDGSRQPDAADRELIERIAGQKTLLVINKVDALLPDISFAGLGMSVPEPIPDTAFPITRADGSAGQAIAVSARSGQNIEALKDAIRNLLLPAAQLTAGSSRDDVLVANIRHKQALDVAAEAMERAHVSLRNHDPQEITALSLREALDALGEIVGVVSTDDILDRIFSRFCIGK